MVNDILQDTEERMLKSITATQHDFMVIRTGRATPALLDGIRVEYYGSKVSLKQVANVAAPDPRLIMVQVFDRTAVSAVEKAIQTSDLGLNPQTDGNLIRLPIPPLNEQRRRDLVKYVHKMAEEGRVAIRNIRRDANEMIKELDKSHDIPEDVAHQALDKIQKLTNEYIEKMDDLLKRKEKEIMEE